MDLNKPNLYFSLYQNCQHKTIYIREIRKHATSSTFNFPSHKRKNKTTSLLFLLYYYLKFPSLSISLLHKYTYKHKFPSRNCVLFFVPLKKLCLIQQSALIRATKVVGKMSHCQNLVKLGIK